ncbi:uncharacterized protein [Lolium perenne]|uniref:uncharacterized protein n=1 Tax=Lolium perenne TaxID=4522 RepID=UPI003A99A329
MGFRDMVLFNQAMLGRQAWRLLTEPDSLCARVLKGRYFPDTDFWNATKPRSSSYTWRSILFGKELVQAGVRWGIGNGKNTKILHDNWIPDVSPDRVTTLNPLPTNATVDLLLDEEACTWDEEVVRDLFDDTTAVKILAVPEVWSRVKARTHLKLHRSLFTTTKSWVFDFLDRASDHAVIILAVMVWHIWNARNGVRHDEPFKHPHSLAEQILAYIDMIQLHLIKHRTNHRREATAPTPSWSPPLEGRIVINVDAALFSASSRTGVGVVVRNHKGEFLAAHSQLLDETMTPEIAEAHAIRCAVSLARDEGWNRIVLASDCLAVIQRIKAPERDKSLVGVVIEDIKFLAHSLSSVTFRHVSRLCNNSAHTVARRAESFGTSFFRVSVPDCIRDKLCLDVI